MRGLETVLGHLIGQKSKGGLEFQLVGRIACTTTDTLLGAGAVRLNLVEKMLSHFRKSEKGTSLRARVMFQIEGKEVSRVPSGPHQLPELPVHGTNVDEQLVHQEIPAANEVVQKLAQMLATHIKP
jgi:hypothetical protein